MSREGYEHIPADLADAIDRYERDKAEGKLRFTHDGEFANMPGDKVGGWIQSFMASRLSIFDSVDRPNENIDYNRNSGKIPVPYRLDGQEGNHG